MFGLIVLFRVDDVVAEDLACGAEDRGCVVVGEDDHFAAGVDASDTEMQHPVGVAQGYFPVPVDHVVTNSPNVDAP